MTSPAAQAAAAAETAGVEVRGLTDLPALHAASALFATVWAPTDPVPFELLRGIQYAGSYVAGAYDGDTLLAAAMGLHADDGNLHSHVVGVLPQARGRQTGFALKLHQRAWALEHGIPVVTWTFDPLARRNAHFNLTKLAARVETYIEDFYGDMPDELNAGDPSDRLVVHWHLADDVVAAAAAGTPYHPPSGTPGRTLVVETPKDIAALRATDPEQARAWRAAQRAALGGALHDGYHVTGLTQDGHYLLERTP